MTGPFFLAIKVIEYVLKYGILLWMWYKKKNAPPAESEKKKDEDKPQAAW